MPWASGLFTRLYNFVDDSIAGVKILASKQDAEWNNVVAGMNNVLCRDGQNSPVVDISWGGHKIINLANGTAPQDAATVAQLPAVYVPPPKTAIQAVASYNQTMAAAAVFYVFPFNIEQLDTLNEFNPIAHTFTAAAAGNYLITGSCCVFNTTNGSSQVGTAVTKNGVIQQTIVSFVSLPSTQYFNMPFSGLLSLAAGDIVAIWFSTSGFNVATGTSTYSASSLSITRV